MANINTFIENDTYINLDNVLTDEQAYSLLQINGAVKTNRSNNNISEELKNNILNSQKLLLLM